jgi:hypothetical protein
MKERSGREREGGMGMRSKREEGLAKRGEARNFRSERNVRGGRQYTVTRNAYYTSMSIGFSNE